MQEQELAILVVVDCYGKLVARYQLTRNAFLMHSKHFGYFRKLERNCDVFKKGCFSSSNYYTLLQGDSLLIRGNS